MRRRTNCEHLMKRSQNSLTTRTSWEVPSNPLKKLFDRYPMEERNAARWDEYWLHFDRYEIFNRIWFFLLWRAYTKLLANINLKPGSKILEIGAGSGRISLKIAKEFGCQATCIDKSEEAIRYEKRRFDASNVKADFINADIFEIAHELREKYDLVHSEGLIEHFIGKERLELMRILKNLVKPGGHVIIFVPTTSISYKVSNFLIKLAGAWYFGFEKPIGLEELISMCDAVNLRVLDHVSLCLNREVGVIAERPL